MKVWLHTLLLCTPFWVGAQIVDSAANKQVDSLIRISRELTDKKDFIQALEINDAAEKMALEKLGRGSAAYGFCCQNRGRVLYYKEDYIEAEKWYLDAIAIREKLFGKEDKDRLAILYRLARISYFTDKNEESEKRFKEVIALQEKTLGKDDPDYIKSVNGYGRNCFQLGKLEEALKSYIEVKDYYAKTEGEGNPDYVPTISVLADVYKELGAYEEAEQLYLEALTISERKYGTNDLFFGKASMNLGRFYGRTGDYAKAESYYLKAKEVYENTIGKSNSSYAWLLNNLGVLYQLMGNNNKAVAAYLASNQIFLEIKKGVDGAAVSYSNMGGIYLSLGEWDKAETALKASISLYEEIIGTESSYYTFPLQSLAGLFFERGDYSRADSIYRYVSSKRKEVFGVESPDYAETLESRAKLHQKTKEFSEAETLLLEAKAIYAKSRGEEGDDYLQILLDLANLYWESGRSAQAEKVFLESISRSLTLIKRSATFCSEQEMRVFIKSMEPGLAMFQSFALSQSSLACAREAFNLAIYLNGLVLENDRLMTRALLSADSSILRIYEQWQGCHRRLAKRYARPIAERKKIAEVEVEAEGYEKLLMRSLPVFQETRKVPKWQDVRDQLKPEECALEFIHFPYSNPNKTDSIRYAALLLRPGWEAPRVVPLFEEKQLDTLLQTSGDRKADYVEKLYSVENRGIIISDKPKKNLYELLWKPLEQELASAKTVYFSPTGLLHRLNLGAIPIQNDSTLSDRYRLIQLGSTRQLTTPSETGFKNNRAALFGGIQFDMDSMAIFTANEKLLSDGLAARGQIKEDTELTNQHRAGWNYLKWTDKEVRTLGSILTSSGFEVDIHSGFDATEETFKSIGANELSPRILHIATHGFFFPDPREGEGEALDEQETGFKTSSNPLIRSGLLLAGANYAWKTGKPLRKGMDNGILTAYEISRMNLTGTELVVLSACETGLGDIEGSEGVYGLQRAFKIAGAKYLIMSLWQVPDFQTQDLMTTFYRKWLDEKMSIPAAFHGAQQEMREKYENPYFWAGFVLME